MWVSCYAKLSPVNLYQETLQSKKISLRALVSHIYVGQLWTPHAKEWVCLQINFSSWDFINYPFFRPYQFSRFSTAWHSKIKVRAMTLRIRYFEVENFCLNSPELWSECETKKSAKCRSEPRVDFRAVYYVDRVASASYSLQASTHYVMNCWEVAFPGNLVDFYFIILCNTQWKLEHNMNWTEALYYTESTDIIILLNWWKLDWNKHQK